MKRHPSLAPLSRDHHHALVLSQSLKHDAPARLTATLPNAPAELVVHVRRRFAAELEPHFAVEESELLPPSRAHGEPLATQATRVQRDHDHLRSLLAAAQPDALLADRLHELAELLEEHVRFEERVWFPTLETELEPDALAELAHRLRFAVTHEGRGGHIAHQSSAGRIVLAIEMGTASHFSVWLRGATLTPPDGDARALRPAERRQLRAQLREWLDATDRVGWVVEG